MLGGRREYVENAAADREFAAFADHVHPGVGQLDQPGDDVFEGQLVAEGQRERFGQAESGGHRLQQRTDRGDHHLQWRTEPGVLWVCQSSQQHHPGTDGVDAGREALVRQRLPRREHRDGVAEDAAQLGCQIVGLAPGRGDDE